VPQSLTDVFASRQRLQLLVMNPTVLPIFGFDAVPVGGGHDNDNFSASVQRPQVRGGVKGGGLELGTGSFDHTLRLAP
jgi:hypothetical protein